MLHQERLNLHGPGLLTFSTDLRNFCNEIAYFNTANTVALLIFLKNEKGKRKLHARHSAGAFTTISLASLSHRALSYQFQTEATCHSASHKKTEFKSSSVSQRLHKVSVIPFTRSSRQANPPMMICDCADWRKSISFLYFLWLLTRKDHWNLPW